jgi:hypothetical protein
VFGRNDKRESRNLLAVHRVAAEGQQTDDFARVVDTGPPELPCVAEVLVCRIGAPLVACFLRGDLAVVDSCFKR